METCIVCLGDLAGSGTLTRRTSQFAPPGEGGTEAVSPTCLEDAPTKNDEILHIKQEDVQTLDSATAIAHLLPCGHDLHNECLKPWVERANSCPICRASFNVVELKARINGPTLDTYAVQDKKQVAEIDPSMIVDDDLFDERAIEPCMICEDFGDDDDVLLLCDGCNASCHTYCVDLDSVPAGLWFCQFCMEDQYLQDQSLHHIAPARPAGRQRRARQGRQGRPGRHASRSDASGEAWARVWQSVWDRLNLDLDFPFDDDLETVQRTETQRRDFAQWQRRFHIAERYGGAARFRDTATALLDRSAPPAESQEELRAWNAFDKAKELQTTEVDTVASPASRKRKSAPCSPAEPVPEPERKLKRPRTRRAQDLADASSDAGAESSTSARRMTDPTVSTPTSGFQPESGTGGPSFFQSLLKEVETTPSSDSHRNRKRLHIETATPVDYSSAGPGSAASSPTNSNHPSPHLGPSPPPTNYHSRPSSPPPLTSRIEPVYAMPSQHLQIPGKALQSDSDESPTDGEPSAQPPLRKDKESAIPTSPPSMSSPPRHGLSQATRAEIREMVKAALKPSYKSRTINTEQYTDINMNISRMLYDRVGEAGGLADETEKERWRAVAADEVDAALKKLGGEGRRKTANAAA